MKTLIISLILSALMLLSGCASRDLTNSSVGKIPARYFVLCYPTMFFLTPEEKSDAEKRAQRLEVEVLKLYSVTECNMDKIDAIRMRQEGMANE